MTLPFSPPGWCLVSEPDGSVSLLWVQEHPLPSPMMWVIAGATREACASVRTCAFVAELNEFRETMLISRVDAPGLLDRVIGNLAAEAGACRNREVDLPSV